MNFYIDDDTVKNLSNYIDFLRELLLLFKNDNF